MTKGPARHRFKQVLLGVLLMLLVAIVYCYEIQSTTNFLGILLLTNWRQTRTSFSCGCERRPRHPVHAHKGQPTS
jgi:hypothetical protein